MLLAGMLAPARFVPRADRVRAAVRAALAEAFGGVDLIAWPCTPTAAPPLSNPWVSLPSGQSPADGPNMRQAAIANLCGIPGIAVPVGLHSSALPMGLQLLAAWGQESVLLDAAQHLEYATQRAYVDLIPPPGVSSKRKDPPSNCTKPDTTVRPKPIPACSLPKRWKGSRIAVRCARGIPEPRSTTSSSRPALETTALIRT